MLPPCRWPDADESGLAGRASFDHNVCIVVNMHMSRFLWSFILSGDSIKAYWTTSLSFWICSRYFYFYSTALFIDSIGNLSLGFLLQWILRRILNRYSRRSRSHVGRGSNLFTQAREEICTDSSRKPQLVQIRSGSMKRGLKQSEVDPCLYVREDLAVLTYIRGWLYLRKSIDDLVKSWATSLDRRGRHWHISECRNQVLWRRIIRSLSTTSYITRILHLLRSDENNAWESSTNLKRVTSDQTNLHRNSEGDGRIYPESWNYHMTEETVVPSTSRQSYLAFRVHHGVRLSIDLKQSHKRAIVGIGRYLLTDRDRGIIYNRWISYKPDTSKD